MTIVDWIVVAALCAASLLVGSWFTRGASQHGATGFFTGNHSVPWWAIGLSNSATYQAEIARTLYAVLLFAYAVLMAVVLERDGPTRRRLPLACRQSGALSFAA